jgi:hypothetical protein
VDENLILKNEPLRRGNGGKPHWAEFCYRTGGETVYVCSRHPNGATEAQYKSILARTPKAKGWGWMTMRRNPDVYVRGRGPARRPRHDHPARLAPGPHEHGRGVEGAEERGVSRLRPYRLSEEEARGSSSLPRALVLTSGSIRPNGSDFIHSG